jgi:hypothetical protein
VYVDIAPGAQCSRSSSTVMRLFKAQRDVQLEISASKESKGTCMSREREEAYWECCVKRRQRQAARKLKYAGRRHGVKTWVRHDLEGIHLLPSNTASTGGGRSWHFTADQAARSGHMCLSLSLVDEPTRQGRDASEDHLARHCPGTLGHNLVAGQGEP